MSELTSKTVKGVTWSTVGTVANSVFQMVYLAVMARLLNPSAFGLLAMASVTLRFGNYFARMGMSQAIIQKPELTKDDIRSAFTSSLLLGVLFFMLTVSFAPLFKYIFNNDEIIPLIRIMSCSFLLAGISMTSGSLLNRNLEFKKIAIIDTCTYLICYLGVGILLAYYGFGVYSLIFASLSQQLLSAILYYLNSRHSIVPLINWKIYKPLFSFGSRISVISFFEFLTSSLDTFVIARFLGAARLGIYERAYKIINLPTYNLTFSFSRVIFPALSKVQNDKNKLKKAYLSSVTLISALLFPICMGMFAASREIILLMLGEDWTAAIPVLAVLTFSIPFKFIAHFGGIVCDATANLNKKLVFQIVYLCSLLLVFAFFRNQGIVVFALIVVCGEFVKNVVYMFIARNILSFTWGEVFRAYYPGIFQGVFVYMGLYGVGEVLEFLHAPLIVNFLVQVFVGFVLLVVTGLIFPRKALKSVYIERFGNLSFLTYKGKNFLHYIKWYRKLSESSKMN